jgi:hypothetical protein
MRWIAHGLLAFSLLWLAFLAPGPFWFEAQGFLGLLLITVFTRTVSAEAALSALGLGIGLSAPLMVFFGHGLEAIGIDPADAPANWTIVAVLEEVVKFVPVLLLSARLWRTLRVTFNPSDWLLLAFAAGTGFALIENTLLVQESSSAAADMRRHYGPHLGGFYLVPGAWGAVGYVGHGAATGLVGAGIGLSLWLRRSGTKVRFPYWVPAVAAFGWIVLEHALANLHVNTGSDATFILGNGRLTPWFYLAVVAAVIVIDARRARASLGRSPVLRKRIGLLKSALVRTTPPAPKSRVTVARMLAGQLRLLNAAAWFASKKRPAEESESSSAAGRASGGGAPRATN